MNQLSWLIYLAGVLGNLGKVFMVISTLVIISNIICVVVALNYDCSSTVEEDRVVRKKAARLLYFMAPLAIVFAIITALCPSRDTVYGIATSQLGEQILKAPVANKAEKALEIWLDKQIHDNSSSDIKKEDKPST